MTIEKTATDLETISKRIRSLRDSLHIDQDNSAVEAELLTIARDAEQQAEDLRDEIAYKVFLALKSLTMIKMARIRKLAMEGNFNDTIPLLFELDPNTRLDVICDLGRSRPDEKVSGVLQSIARESHRHLRQTYADNTRSTKISLEEHPYAGRFPTATEFKNDLEMDGLISEGWIPVGDNFPTFGPSDNTPETVQNAWEIKDFLQEGFEATCTAKAYDFENPASKKIDDYHTQIFIRPKTGCDIHPAYRQYYDTVRKLIVGN
jgi:hypothetical protein